MSDAKRPSPSVPDIESLDAGWEDEDEDLEEEEDEEEEDLEALDSGWDTAKRRKSAEEKAQRRKEQARRKAEKRKARAAEVAQKQKRKKGRSKDANGTSTNPFAGESMAPAAETADDEVEEKRESKPRVKRASAAQPARSLRRDWTKMAMIVGAIVAVAAIAFYLLGKH